MMREKPMGSKDSVTEWPILYRKEEYKSTEDRREEYEARREQIEEMFNYMSPEVQLDLILMFVNTAEMRLSTAPPGTHVAEWLDVLTRALRQLLMVMTHLQPDSPKPSIMLEDPNLYWPTDSITLN
tara:strand:- start:504 stop:881 length:378 start_codon:yes stop_codon:yes gene_type:complete